MTDHAAAKTPPSRPGLSAVVVSWNSARFLPDCLDSLASQKDVQVEVIVVDNGSTDGSADIVRRERPSVTLIETKENRGFCAANNTGLGAAGRGAVLFVNPDVVLDPAFCARAVSALDTDPRIGIVGGRLLRFDRTTIDSAGQFMTRSRRVLDRGYGGPDGPGMGSAGYVFSVCGAAMLCRRETIEDISVCGELFDESFFAFSEDFDIGWRARLAGWRAWYEPEAVGYHYRGGSEDGSGAGRRLPALLRRPRPLRFHILKNRWLTMLKNDAASSVLRDLPFIAVRDAALVGATAFVSPGVLLDLIRAGRLVRGALRRRREFLSRRGPWGARRCGAPSAWVRWREPVASDPGER
jgi:GT2 family glycosyltransferase